MKKLTAFLCMALACLIPGVASAANHLNNVGVLVDDTGASVLALYGFTTGTPHTNQHGFLIDDTGALVVTGISAGGSGDALVANPLSQFAATTSAQLAATISNETGTGLAVFGTGPTITLPNATALPEGGLSTTDITTNNATTSKHGFLLKLDNTATHYMDGTGAWSTPASGVTWDAITNAAGALTLANGTNATTFNQTSAANWTWADTTAATSSTVGNAPILNVNGTYWTGAASAAESLSSTLTTATGTNGTVTQLWQTSGSTAASTFRFNGQSTTQVTIAGAAGGTDYFQLLGGGSNNLSLKSTGVNMQFGLFTTLQSGTGPGFTINSSNNMANTSGTLTLLQIANSGNGTSFNPTTGTGKFIALNLAPTINQTGSATGDYTALQVDTTETAVTGTNKLLADFKVGGTSKAKIDDLGGVTGAGFISADTKFTSNSGCTEGTTVGGSTAGKFTVGQNTACTVVITMGNSAASPNGWACAAYDQTAVPAVAIRQTASNTTTASLLMTVATNDVVTFQCMGY